jgi:hypothetical protein
MLLIVSGVHAPVEHGRDGVLQTFLRATVRGYVGDASGDVSAGSEASPSA